MKSLLNKIENARKELKESRKIRCTCSSFYQQYEGCGCEAKSAPIRVENKLMGLLRELEEKVKEKEGE